MVECWRGVVGVWLGLVVVAVGGWGVGLQPMVEWVAVRVGLLHWVVCVGSVAWEIGKG